MYLITFPFLSFCFPPHKVTVISNLFNEFFFIWFYYLYLDFFKRSFFSYYKKGIILYLNFGNWVFILNMLLCSIYITGWDCNLFIWQLYNILLCYTIPPPPKNRAFELSPGFAIINSSAETFLCLHPPLNIVLCTSVSHHSTLQPRFCTTFWKAFLILRFGQNSGEFWTAHRVAMWKSNMTPWQESGKVSKWRQNNGDHKQKISKSVPTLKKSMSVQWCEPRFWENAN